MKGVSGYFDALHSTEFPNSEAHLVPMGRLLKGLPRRLSPFHLSEIVGHANGRVAEFADHGRRFGNNYSFCNSTLLARQSAYAPLLTLMTAHRRREVKGKPPVGTPATARRRAVSPREERSA